jgi:hypothetical protein
MIVYPASRIVHQDTIYHMARDTTTGERRLIVQGNTHGFSHGEKLDDSLWVPLTSSNAALLRERLPWLRPVPLGLQTSMGFGDRLGLATPGHVRAVQGTGLAPIFAQQSIREMTRTERTPEEVLSDATWGAFQAGWQAPVGADADHLKSTADIDACAQAGYSLFTFDPGAYVDVKADLAATSQLIDSFDDLPWEGLETSAQDFLATYADRIFDLGECELLITREEAMRAAVKYGRAIIHVAKLYRHLASKGMPFECEVSVDETDRPTSHGEHYCIAGELKRLGVQWIGLAPRFVGQFEKGVDYIGRPEELAKDLAGHAVIARYMGPYKLSLHSGSDKFSVYPHLMEATRGALHVKTAGTSYLEALRVIAHADTTLFRVILAFARSQYTVDRASYYVSAQASRVPVPESVRDEDLPSLLDQFDAREVLHVTYGSVLAQWGRRLRSVLSANSDAYYATLQRHFGRHVAALRSRSAIVA